MKLLAFAASNSSTSINRKLAHYAASLMPDAEVETVDIHDYELPIFSQDRERELGQPQLAKDFLRKLQQPDALIISYAEHNGSYTAAWKNLTDWVSRIDNKYFANKPMIIMATSPGAGGAKSVLEQAQKSAPFFGANIVAAISVAKFNDNFDTTAGRITNPEIDRQIREGIALLSNAVAEKT